MSDYELWLPSEVAREMKGNADNDVSYREALNSVLMEYGYSTAEIELRREDVGWTRLSVSDTGGAPVYDRVGSVKNARVYYLRDPLSKQAIRIWTGYSIGRGINWQAADEGADKILREFWGATANQSVLSTQGQGQSSDKLLVDGEVFFVFFPAKGNGVTKIRRIDPLEITEIITDPDDRDTVLLYKREFWAGSTMHTLYYPDYTNETPNESARDKDGKEVTADQQSPIYHVAFNTLAPRGVSLLYSAMDWSRAHRKFVEARASITQALAKFAWKAKVKGGSTAVSAVQSQLQSSLATGRGTENNPPAAAGSTWVENQGLDLTPIKTESGASAAQTDANMLLQMFGAAVGVFPHYFGAGEAFRLATATAMERPMQIQFESYQKMWSDTYDNIFNYVLNENNISEDKRFIDIDFPPITEKDAMAAINAVAQIITVMPALDTDEVRKLVLTNLGVNNPEEVLDGISTEESAAYHLAKALRDYKVALKEGSGDAR